MSKLLTFVQLYAMMRLKRLVKLDAEKDVYAVTPEVAFEALELILPTLTGVVAKIEKRVKAVLDALREVSTTVEFAGETTSMKCVEKGAEITEEVREQIAKRLHKSEMTIHQYFKTLKKSGYVS